MGTIASLKTPLTWLGRLILGGTFVYAAGSKILDPAGFVADIGHYRLLPYPLAVTLGVYLPWVELLCGIAVLTRRLEQGALFLLIALCAVFAVAISSALVRGLDIDCGCFGHGPSASLTVALARSVTLGLIALWLARQTTQHSSNLRRTTHHTA